MAFSNGSCHKRQEKPGSRWFHGLRQALATLADFPRRCALAPETAVFSFEVRQLLYGRKPHVYRTLFAIEGETVHIFHIRHVRASLSDY